MKVLATLVLLPVLETVGGIALLDGMVALVSAVWLAAEGMDAKGGMDAAGGRMLAVGRTTVAGSLGACFFASSFFSFSSSSMSSMSHLLKVGGSIERVDFFASLTDPYMSSKESSISPSCGSLVALSASTAPR